MQELTTMKKTKEKIALIINSVIDIIKYPEQPANNSAYFYRISEKNNFLIYLYLFKLSINSKEYLEMKYINYLNKFTSYQHYDLTQITNIPSNDEIDLLLSIKEKLDLLEFYYDENEEKIIFYDNTYVNSRWFLSFITLLLDNTRNNDMKEINVCYTIPSRDTSVLRNKEDLDNFLQKFTYYNIKVKRTDKTKQVRENNILIVKNAAINYLKHLKQYKHGLENEESYLIFYNLLKNECRKEGFELSEEEKELLDIESKKLEKIYSIIDENFFTYQLSKQVHIIENVVWQSSNDITLLENMNTSIDNLIDLFTILRLNQRSAYAKIKSEHNINDIKILMLLITNQFLLTYLTDSDEIDYSLLDLSSIKPKYMNHICNNQEQDIKSRLRSFDMELSQAKSILEKYKEERSTLNKEELGPEKYQKELERCVSNINRESIKIGRLNSNISALSREYEELKKHQIEKYRNVDLYNYNHSIIRHICNSILGCSYYLKTSNNSSLFNNIIIFEDYEKTDNSFYLEVTFKELLKISSQYLLNGIIDQYNLPKLA